MVNSQKSFALTVFFIVYSIDVFLLSSQLSLWSDTRLIFIILFWLFLSKFFKFNYITTYKFVLVNLFLLFFLFLFFRTSSQIERVAELVYIFLALGVFQQFKDILFKNNHKSE